MQQWKSKRSGVIHGNLEAKSVAAVSVLRIFVETPSSEDCTKHVSCKLSNETPCPVLVQNWDNEVIAMLDRCPSDKCFISHYPPAHNDSGSVQVPDSSQSICPSTALHASELHEFVENKDCKILCHKAEKDRISFVPTMQ